jgi:hypothetical protein
LDFDPFEFDYDPAEVAEEEGNVYDEYEQNAESAILETISQQQVVTDRELKVRLERRFFPWVVGRTLNRLIEKGYVRIVHPPGRKGGMGTPDNFYLDKSADYERLLKLILRKKRVSVYVNSLLTKLSPAGFFAEEVFESAFSSLRFKIHGTNVSEFRGRKVVGVSGKQPPDLDFVIEKDKIVYGVDIKNWIKYEFDSIDEVKRKVDVAVQLRITPFICARYVDKDTFFKVVSMPGIVYSYETLILPPEFQTLAEEARSLLGYPVLVGEALPQFKLDFIKKLHGIMLNKLRKKR